MRARAHSRVARMLRELNGLVQPKSSQIQIKPNPNPNPNQAESKSNPNQNQAQIQIKPNQNRAEIKPKPKPSRNRKNPAKSLSAKAQPAEASRATAASEACPCPAGLGRVEAPLAASYDLGLRGEPLWGPWREASMGNHDVWEKSKNALLGRFHRAQSGIQSASY